MSFQHSREFEWASRLKRFAAVDILMDRVARSIDHSISVGPTRSLVTWPSVVVKCQVLQATRYKLSDAYFIRVQSRCENGQGKHMLE